MVNNTRYKNKDYNLFNSTVYNTDFGLLDNDVVELHLYNLDDTRIISNNNLLKLFWKQEKITGLDSINLDLKSIFNELQVTRGDFKIKVNFLRDIVGSYLTNKLYVNKIIGNEIELKSTTNIDYTILQEFIDNDLKDLVLNFGNDLIYQIINIEIIDHRTIFIKTYVDLSNDVELNSECWLSYEVVYPYNDKVLLLDEIIIGEETRTLSPNYDINVNENISIATDLKNWNTLLGTKLSVLNEILLQQVNGVNLNIQYNDFENFVHFSSAKERVINFKYKLQQLEQYEAEIYSLTNISGSIVPTNILETYNNRDEILSSFDDFEKHLYYDVSGSLYTHETGLYDTWPKYSPDAKRTWESKLETWNNVHSLPTGENVDLTVSASINSINLYSVTSSEGIAYYDNLFTSASYYDDDNIDSLVTYVPEFIKIDQENDSFMLFVNMIAQHFDLIWLYIKELENIFTIEQHPKDGTSIQLLSTLSEMFGWKLESDLNTTELYDYILGTSNIGDSQTWDDSLPSKNKLELMGEVWKRIINNLPLILKTKGTKKSVQALLSCYGIPDTILKVREFGKASIDDNTKPTFIDESFKYGLNLSNAEDTYLEIPWGELAQNGEYPKALEFRIKMDTDYTYSDNHEETILEIIDLPVIGDLYGGGTVAYIIQPDDPTYEAGTTKGLIIALTDQTPATAFEGHIWSNIDNVEIGASAQYADIGSGLLNSHAIVSQSGHTNSAALICLELIEGGYSDWHLPTIDELSKVYINRASLGYFYNYTYWSSTEAFPLASSGNADGIQWDIGTSGSCNKDNEYKIRAVRYFEI